MIFDFWFNTHCNIFACITVISHQIVYIFSSLFFPQKPFWTNNNFTPDFVIDLITFYIFHHHSFWTKQCVDIFGPAFNETSINRAVDWTNANYGGYSMNQPRVGPFFGQFLEDEVLHKGAWVVALLGILLGIQDHIKINFQNEIPRNLKKC